jgi:hypothetical protein
MCVCVKQRQQVCCYALGMPSQVSSVDTALVFVKDACVFVGACRSMPDVESEEFEYPSSSSAAAAEPERHAPDSLQSQRDYMLRTQQDFNAFPLEFGHAPSYHYRDPSVPEDSTLYIKCIVMPQHRFYADRGAEAAHTCLWEYACLFEAEKSEALQKAMRKNQERQKTKKADDIGPVTSVGASERMTTPTTGLEEQVGDAHDEDQGAVEEDTGKHQRNLRVALTDTNILHSDYVLKLKSKVPIPVFTGRRPDKMPPYVPEGQDPDADWLRAAEQFAQRMLVVFSPWVSVHHLAHPELFGPGDTEFLREDLFIPEAMIDISPEDQGRTDYERLLDFMQSNTKTFIGRCKNRMIQNLSENLESVQNADNTRSLLLQYRSRAATRWQSKGMDVCQINTIGVPRKKFTRVYEKQLDEREFAKQLQEDADLERETAEFHILVAGAEFKPTPHEKGDKEFCDKQTAAFASIYDSAYIQEQARGRGRAITTLTSDGCLTEHTAHLDQINGRLINKFEIKTPPPVITPSAPGDADIVADTLRPEEPNADQLRVLDILRPKITEYSLFNMDPGSNAPVAPLHMLVTGGPGTGKTFLYRQITAAMNAAGISYLSAGALGSCAVRLCLIVQTYFLFEINLPPSDIVSSRRDAIILVLLFGCIFSGKHGQWRPNDSQYVGYSCWPQISGLAEKTQSSRR